MAGFHRFRYFLAGVPVAYAATTPRELVYQRLAADEALAGLVGTRIYPGWLPRGAALPALSWRVPRRTQGRLLSGDRGDSVLRAQFDCWANDPGQAEAIAEALVALWQDYADTVAGLQVFRCRLVDESDFEEPPADGSDAWTHRLRAEYAIHYRHLT